MLWFTGTYKCFTGIVLLGSGGDFVPVESGPLEVAAGSFSPLGIGAAGSL